MNTDDCCVMISDLIAQELGVTGVCRKCGSKESSSGSVSWGVDCSSADDPIWVGMDIQLKPEAALRLAEWLSEEI